MIALRMLLLMTVLTGLVYPFAITGLAQLLFHEQANGSRLASGGSSLIGRQFDKPEQFWSRLSATSPAAYNGLSSSGSNFGPRNPDLKKAIDARRAALLAADPGNAKPIPIDLLTSSASGLDPHISPEAAEYQASRVARLRGIPLEQVRSLIAKHTTARQLDFLGEPTVNVALLNRDLDHANKRE